ncbi:uncharacterized protein LOC144651836 [Oculina patagonica]
MLSPKCNVSTNSKQKRKQTPSLRSTDWKSSLSIAAGAGFTVAEQNKVDEIKQKGEDLANDVNAASDMYDHIYYMVAVNLDRVKKSLDKLPSDFLEKVSDDITEDTKKSDAEEAVQTVANIMGYTGAAAGLAAGILQVVRYFRTRRAQGEEPPDEPITPELDPFEYVPLEGEMPPVVPEYETSFSSTPKLDKTIKGLGIATLVFGLGGLGVTIGLGSWTMGKLNDALQKVEEKQKTVTEFQNAMVRALDPIVSAAGLQPKNYGGLTEMTKTWKTISENYDSYEKALYIAIRGYFMKKSLDEVKGMVKKNSDAGRPFPDDGYPLAKTLADDIKYEFEQKKTDKEIVSFFATENPKIGLRFVFNEFFITSLRWIPTINVST